MDWYRGSSTAAGTTSGCVDRVAELTFATFRATNAQVAVPPQMQDVAGALSAP